MVAGIGLCPGTASAAPKRPTTPELIERDKRERKIDDDTANVYLAYAIGRPEKLPAAYRSDSPWDGTLPLLRLREAVKRMKPGPRREAAEEAIGATAAGTGTCSGSTGNLANETQTTNFYVQYGTVGGGLTVNDYLASLETTWTKEVATFGWARPPVAPTPAPGGKYHVRIDALGSGLYGYVINSGTHAGFVGNNPFTTWDEGDAYATCMVLNNDYSGFPSPPQASLDATTAHEFNHSIQFGYGALHGANTPDDNFVEGGATWMEDEVFDSANDNYEYLWPTFGDSMGDYDDSPYPYWITFRGLTERYGTGAANGGEQVMQDFWEETSKNSGNNLTAMQTALANRGTTLADAYHAYAVAVKFNRACGGGYVYPYCFEEGPAYVAAAGPTVVHKTIAAVGGSTSGASVEDNYALNWVALPTSGGPYDVTLQNTSAGGQLRGTVACDTGTALSLSPLPTVVGAAAGTTLAAFNPSSCSGTPVLVITNQSQTAANPTNSTARSYQVSTASGAAPPQFALTVAKAGAGSGTITSSPAGINCGLDCSESYDSGTPVTLTATPTDGSTFSGWTGACSGSATTCNVSMTAAQSVTATFAPQPVAQHELTVSKSGSGSVTSSPSGIDCGLDCTEPYASDTSVTLTAAPAAGWRFSGWSGSCSGTSTCAVTMSADRSVTASFVPVTTGSSVITAPPGPILPATPTTPDRTAPTQASLRLSSTAFRAARSGPSARSAASVGTRVGYRLSEPAVTRFRVERAVRGRRVGGRCVRVTRANAGRRPCTRYLRVRGSFTRSGRAGANSFRFTGRLAARALRPGRYRLVATSTDAAGNRSTARRVRFRIVR